MTALEQRVSRLEQTVPPDDGGKPALVRIVRFEDGAEERLHMRLGIIVWTERTEPDPAA